MADHRLWHDESPSRCHTSSARDSTHLVLVGVTDLAVLAVLAVSEAPVEVVN